MAPAASSAMGCSAPGDTVLAFATSALSPAGALLPRRVTRLFSNITQEWLVLRACGADPAAIDLTVTPGHRFLCPDGAFRRIDDILATDGEVVPCELL